jgi:hypothetical protein
MQGIDNYSYQIRSRKKMYTNHFLEPEELASRQTQLGNNTLGLANMLSGPGGTVLLVMNPLLQFVAYIGSIIFVHKSRSALQGPNTT